MIYTFIVSISKIFFFEILNRNTYRYENAYFHMSQFIVPEVAWQYCSNEELHFITTYFPTPVPSHVSVLLLLAVLAVWNVPKNMKGHSLVTRLVPPVA